MKIGVPKEVKIRERRVALTPAGAAALVDEGHRVFIEKSAGVGSGISNREYSKAGAEIVETADAVWNEADMIVKVKEPIQIEYNRIRNGQLIFTFLHLAAEEKLAKVLLDKKVIGVAYETIRLGDGSLPLLAPMSEVAGRLSIQMACACLEVKNGGKGLLLSGVPGVAPAKVAIIGGGIAGVNAAHLAVGMGAQVTIIDNNISRLRHLEDIFHSRAVLLMSNPTNLYETIANADVVIGSVLIPGARAPKLIKREYIKKMSAGSVIVDIAIDQGGCAETSRPTNHNEPTFIEEGVVHYCVTNMPGAVPRTSTFALTNATLPYILKIAKNGIKNACANDIALRLGVNVFQGKLTCREVAEALTMKYTEVNF